MKSFFPVILFLLMCSDSFSQTNTFPPNGNAGIGITTPLADLDIFRVYNANKPTTLKMFYQGSWISVPYANEFRFLDLSSTEGGKVLQVNGYGMGLGFDPPVFASSNKLLVNGNVGLGTNQPGARLELKGGPAWTSNGWTKSIKLNLTNTIQFSSDGGQFGIGATNPGGLYFFSTAAEDNSQPANYLMTILNSGNIGIGTTSPNSKLTVNGNIRAREIKVENANWPDYVFAKSYVLPGLSETEKFIKENGHLPGLPSASEVKANGIDLGEMNALLLKKIEELTLHLIDQNKKFENKLSIQEKQNLENKEKISQQEEEIKLLLKKGSLK